MHDGAIAGGEGSRSLFLIKLACLAAFSGEINKSVLTSLKSGLLDVGRGHDEKVSWLKR